MNLLDKAVDLVAKIFGLTEEAAHRPLYPITNYMSIVDHNMIRGSWPTKEMLHSLKSRGVIKVINLCAERGQDDEVIAAGMEPYNILICDDDVPKVSDVVELLAIMSTVVGNAGQVYIHCEEGIGRTGCMVAAYRIKLCGWNNVAALQEAERFGLALPDQKQFILALR